MFTDEPVTPVRVETLVDLLRNSRRRFDRAKLLRVLQPEPLPDLREDSKRAQAKATLRAASELELVVTENGSLRTTIESGDARPTREIVLEALDRLVLSSLAVEPYFALFFSYLLAQGKAGDGAKDDNLILGFQHDVFAGERTNNPFNSPKLAGLKRWLHYAGLGWFDTERIFQANPYERLRRSLPSLFSDDVKLGGGEFMKRLAVACPELDGGAIYRRADPKWSPDGKKCSLGLSHALLELHLDGFIQLHCFQDSRGWSIAEAEPLNLQSDRIDFVERRKA